MGGKDNCKGRLEAPSVYIWQMYLFGIGKGIFFYLVKVRVFAKSVTTMYMLIRRLFLGLTRSQ